jgi:hypothetical protein
LKPPTSRSSHFLDCGYDAAIFNALLKSIFFEEVDRLCLSRPSLGDPLDVPAFDRNRFYSTNASQETFRVYKYSQRSLNSPDATDITATDVSWTRPHIAGLLRPSWLLVVSSFHDQSPPRFNLIRHNTQIDARVRPCYGDDGVGLTLSIHRSLNPFFFRLQ